MRCRVRVSGSSGGCNVFTQRISLWRRSKHALLGTNAGTYSFSALLYEFAALQANDGLLMLNMFAIRHANAVCLGGAVHICAMLRCWHHFSTRPWAAPVRV